MQAMPVFVYLIPAVFFFGVGQVPGIAATIVFAIPPAVRLTELGIRQMDSELLEAAQAFGAKKSLILRDVQLPLAFPSIMVGVNQVIMLALSMVVVAGLVGAGGLGGVVVQGVAQLDTARGFEGGLAVVILAVYLDRVTGGASSLPGVLRKGSRLRKERAAAKAITPQVNPEPALAVH
jgi:glycine betaine/proline transport system permease protein